MKIKRLAFAAAMICLLSLIISAQQKKTYGKVSIKTPYGYLFISNSSEKSFTMEIRGKDIEVVNEGNNRMFIVDEKLLNIVQVDTKNFVSASEKLTEEQILEKHKAWESEFRSQAFKTKLELKTEPVTVKDFKAMLWGYRRPLANEEYDRDYLLTKLIGKEVLALNTSLYTGEKLADYQKFLVETLSTLKISSEPFDVQKLTEEFRRESEKKTD
jgi:hypothetical protein